jgi:hypothetical protein
VITGDPLAAAKSPTLRRFIAAQSAFLLICRVFISCYGSVASPQAQATPPCADEAGNDYSVPLFILAAYSALLLICRVFFSFCDSVASPQQSWHRPGQHGHVVRPKLLPTTPTRSPDSAASHRRGHRSKHRPEHRDQVRATHSERRRGQQPRQHGQVRATHKE